MLIKLLKYDLKSMLKTIVPLWIGTLVVSIFFGVLNAFQSGDNNRTFIIFFLGLTLFCLFVAVVVVNFILVIQRFWNGLLKEEGYLMFTIPTTPRMLIISKVLSSTIISMGTALIGYISVMIAMLIYMNSFSNSLLSDLANFISYLDSNKISVILTVIATVIIGTIQKIYVFYLAMAIGHLSNKNRFLCSFGAFILINIVTGMIGGVFVQIGDMVSNYEILDTMTKTMWSASGLCVVLIIITHIATEYILTKKLNLE